jgi:hypothetical protein
MKSNIAVYNSRLAKILVNKGYHIIDLAINHKNNRDLIFFFENKPEVWQVIKEYETITKQYKQQIREQLKGGNIDEHKNISGSISSEQ